MKSLRLHNSSPLIYMFFQGKVDFKQQAFKKFFLNLTGS